MKPTLRRATPQIECSFIVRKDVGHMMRNDWHYHPDYEILYIKRSAGTWLIGDYVGQFKSGDIIFLGPNLPHSFRHDYSYIQAKNRGPGEAIVTLFQKEIFGNIFLNMPEIKEIKHLLKLSEKGLKLTGNTKRVASGIMEKIIDKNPSGRLIDLIRLLHLIAEANEYQILASEGFTYNSDGIDNARISAILEYTFNNYHTQIRIEDVAALINMEKHTFCRYFKEKTKKTYIQFLMEVRVGIACKLLIEEDMNSSEVCYTCGYSSVSHFSHQFKAIKGKSPQEYKQHYMHSLSGS